MEEGARISQLRQRPCTPILQPVFSLRNHFSPDLHNLQPVHPVPSPWQQEGWTPIQHVCKHTAEPVTAVICWVFPSSSSEDWLFPIAREGDGQGDGQGRRCCPLAFSPAEKGPMERCVCGEVCAMPGAIAVPTAGPAALGSRRALSAHPPRDARGGCKTPVTCAGNCCNTLAGESHSSLSPAPRTTGPASSGTRRCPHALPAALPARGSGRCSGLAGTQPAGREGGTAPHSIRTFAGYPPPTSPL